MSSAGKIEHTPLPWRKGFGQTATEKYIDIYGADNRTIAKLPVTDETRAEQEANADLILAALTAFRSST